MSEEVSALYFHIVFVEEPITAAEYKILYDRTRLTLQVRLVHVQLPVLQVVLAGSITVSSTPPAGGS